MKTRVQRTRRICTRSCTRGEPGAFLSRSASARNQPAARTHASAESCARPSARRSHCHVASGLSESRPRSVAVRRTRSSSPQNRTAGPQRGPPAKSSQRPSGRWRTTLAFTAGCPSATRGARSRTPMPRGSGNVRWPSCRTASTVSVSFSPSGRIGRFTPPTVSSCTSAPRGSVRTSGLARLARTDRSSDASERRRRGRVSSATESMVTVCPSIPCGLRKARERDSPGHGRNSPTKRSPSCRATGGTPVAVHSQTGPHRRIHTSDQGRPSGAFRVTASFSTGRSVDDQRVSVWSRPIVTTTSPSFTSSSPVVSIPFRSGTRRTTGTPGGLMRRTIVSTLHETPMSKLRTISNHGSYRASADVPPASPFSLRVSWIEPSVAPSSRTPSTCHPSAATVTRRGRARSWGARRSLAGEEERERRDGTRAERNGEALPLAREEARAEQRHERDAEEREDEVHRGRQQEEPDRLLLRDRPRPLEGRGPPAPRGDARTGLDHGVRVLLVRLLLRLREGEDVELLELRHGRGLLGRCDLRFAARRRGGRRLYLLDLGRDRGLLRDAEAPDGEGVDVSFVARLLSERGSAPRLREEPAAHLAQEERERDQDEGERGESPPDLHESQ